jgi:hypothetical protein
MKSSDAQLKFALGRALGVPDESERVLIII